MVSNIKEAVQDDEEKKVDIGKMLSLPQKRYYRQRAHSNPIADHSFEYPAHPGEVDWSKLYPKFSNYNPIKHVEFADIGCGYGGFLLTLSEIFPDRLSIGLEIRVKVSDYVIDRIKALRSQYPNKYDNVACIRTNAMKYLPNYFMKHQLNKMFFLYPDPHFKKAKHKWRIINQALLSEYAYVLTQGGLVYTMTDVEDLHYWIVGHMKQHPLFERLSAEEEINDLITPKLYQSSEEGIKVVRNGGSHFLAIFRRI